MRKSKRRKVIVVGLDGLDPREAERLMAAGRLPNLRRLREVGGYSRLGTTAPAQTPVAWSTFATGMTPADHGIVDFLSVDPANYAIDQGLVEHRSGGRFRLPSVVNRRQGAAVWTQLGDEGVPSVVLRSPCTYPPDAVHGSLLSGMGVSDLRGSFGSPTLFVTGGDAKATSGERVERWEARAGAWKGRLEGPRLSEGGPSAVDVVLTLGPVDGALRLGDGAAHKVTPGQWSPWLRVQFRAGRLRSAHAILRVLLLQGAPEPSLYVSALHMDPGAPLFKLSAPWSFGGDLAADIGLFGTAGFIEEHTGLLNGQLDEAQFLAHCTLTHAERAAMFSTSLDRFDAGLLFCLFDTPDRVQHMFWRFGEADHPANREHPSVRAGDWSDAIATCYASCDLQVGEALRACDDQTVMVVLSDHGFDSYRRQVHLNTWLERAGWLTRKEQSGAAPADFLADVDWTRTRAFAAGLGGIYLNVAGRERDGIVDPSDRARVAEALAEALSGVSDPETGRVAVTRALTAEAVYGHRGIPRVPDVLALMSPGYRASAATAIGGGGEQVFEDNTSRWSGDHVFDPVHVPGVLFANVPFPTQAPTMMDLAPSLLSLFGVPASSAHHGRVLFNG